MRNDKSSPVPTNIEMMLRKSSENTRKAQKKEDRLRDLREKFRRAMAVIGSNEQFANYCEKHKMTKNAREYAIGRAISKTKKDVAELMDMSFQCKEFKSYANNPRVQHLCELSMDALELDFVENEDNQADAEAIQNVLRKILRHSTNEANKIRAAESLTRIQERTGDNATLARWRQIWTQSIIPFFTQPTDTELEEAKRIIPSVE